MYSGRLAVFTVPTLADAYAYVLADKRTGAAAVVDAAEADLVMEVSECRRRVADGVDRPNRWWSASDSASKWC